MKTFIKNNIRYIILTIFAFAFFTSHASQVNASFTYTDYYLPYSVVVTNIPPSANAGPDRTITPPANSDTLPNGWAQASDPDGTVQSVAWTQILSYPSQVKATISNSTTLTPTFTFSPDTSDIYTFRLTATDNQGATSYNDMHETINTPGSNIPPIADAGPDQTITLPNNFITATAGPLTVDPDGVVVGYSWTQSSGPSTSSIASPNSSSTSITNLVQGVYTFQLVVTDNQGAQSTPSIMTVTVNPDQSNLPPVCGATHYNCNPGKNPDAGGNSQDADGTYHWICYGTGSYSSESKACSEPPNPGGGNSYTISICPLPPHIQSIKAESGGPTYSSGSTPTYDITTDPGYKISSITVDGPSVGNTSPYTFPPLSSSHTICAYAQKKIKVIEL